MDLRNNRFNRRFSISNVLDEQSNSRRIMENMLFSKAIVYNLKVSYDTVYKSMYRELEPEGHVFLEHSFIGQGKREDIRHTDTFYSNIYHLIRKVSRKEGLQRQAGFFEHIKTHTKNLWYYSLAMVSRCNKNNFPTELNIISIPIDQNSGFAKKARMVFELDSFRISNQNNFNQLTKREIEVLKCIAIGQNNPKIAEELFISRRTVEQHRKNLNRKLSPQSIGDLLTYAQAFDLV